MENGKMKQVRIRRHPLYIHFTLVLVTLLCGGYGFLLTWMYCDLFVKNALEGRAHLLPVVIIGCFFMLYYTWKRYMHSVPIVVCDGQHIYFNNQRHAVSDISKISFSGKFPFKYFRSYMMEGMRIDFNDGSVRILFDDYHSNLGELKCFLNEIISNEKRQLLKGEIEQANNSSGVLLNQTVVIYRHHILSFTGLVFYFFLAFVLMCIHFVMERNQYDLLIMAGVGSFTLIALSHQFHYFMLEESWFIVRNSLWFWRKKLFNLSNIKEVVFETAANGVTSARVITNDFDSHAFPAVPLREKDWTRLAQELELRQVTVRDDAFGD